MNEEISNKLNGYFEVDETYENENWIRTKIRTFAFGKNRNGSDIIKSSMSKLSKAQKSIGAIPIVAKYNNDKDDLEGHNVILRKNKDNEYEMFHDTDALGFTSPTSTFYMEEVNEGTDITPDYKTYIVIEDVYLWKRFDATKKILEWYSNGISTKVSMEIDGVEGLFDNDGYFSISDFIFTAITALGSDVVPCFPKAEIQLYTINDFKVDLKQFMYELTIQKEVDEQEGGINQVEDINIEEQTETKTDFVDIQEEIQAQEEIKNRLENNPTATVEVDEEDETVVEPTEPIEPSEEPEPVEETTPTEDETPVEPSTEPDDGAETSIEGDSSDGGVFTVSEEDYNALNSNFENLEIEVEKLRTYKRERELKDLKDKFSTQVSEQELDSLFTSKSGVSLEELELEIFALIGKKNYSLEPTKQKQNKVSVVSPQKDANEFNPYGDIFK